MASIGDTTRPAFAYDQATDTWVPVGIGPHSHTAAGVGAVATSSFAAKGDLLVGTGAGTLVAQTVGANGTVLTADSTQADGVKWAVPAAGKNFTLLNTGGTALTGASTITVSGITNADSIMVLVDQAAYSSGTSAFISIRINGDTAANYSVYGQTASYASTYSPTNYATEYGLNSSVNIRLGRQSSDSSSKVSGYCLISGGNSSGVKVFNSVGNARPESGSAQMTYNVGGVYTSASTISSISVANQSGNFTGGTVYVYTSA